jgi:hypothetical protein
MPRKTKIEPEPEGAEDILALEGSPARRENTRVRDIETVEVHEETKEEEIEEDKPITKPKRVLTEKQLESLKRAREAAALKKRELKELAQKAKALPKKEIEVKAAEYDKLEEKKKQLQTATAETKPIKKTTKKVIEVEEEEEEEVIVKKQPKKINNTSLDQEVSMLSIQQKLKLERQKMLMNTLSPMC